MWTHPPSLREAPLVSSPGPPGVCMTPSRETNSSTLTFLMSEFLRVLSDFVSFNGRPRFSMSQVMPLGRRDADPARGTQTLARQAGIAGSVVTAAQLLPLGSSVRESGAPRPAPDRRRQPCAPTPVPRPDQRLPAPKNRLWA